MRGERAEAKATPREGQRTASGSRMTAAAAAIVDESRVGWREKEEDVSERERERRRGCDIRCGGDSERAGDSEITRNGGAKVIRNGYEWMCPSTK